MITRKGRRIKHRYRNTAVYTFYEKPVDWWDLKKTFRDIARAIYDHHEQQTLSIITIYKHLAGKGIRKIVNYKETKLHYRRQPELDARIKYKPLTDEVKVETVNFYTPEFYDFKADYRRERKEKWALKPVIEKGFEATLLNPEAAFMNLLNVKNSIYDRPINDGYLPPQEKQHTMGSYAKRIEGMYGANEDNTLDRDRDQRENTF